MGQDLLEKKTATMTQLQAELIQVWFHDILYDMNQSIMLYIPQQSVNTIKAEIISIKY